MRSLEVTIKPAKRGERIKLVPISCLHVGHHSHEREKTQELLARGLADPNTFFINLGDSGDNGTKQSPGASVYENPLNPWEQCIVIAALLRPVVAAGKMLWWHNSNHSERTYKETGFFTMEETLARLFFGRGIHDKTWSLLNRYAEGEFHGKTRKDMAKRVDVEQYLDEVVKQAKVDDDPAVKWAGWQALTKLHAGDQEYMIHSMHGEGSGVAASSALQAVMKQEGNGLADLYIRGHHHKRVAADSVRPIWAPGGKVQMRRVGFVTTGCMLGYHDSYGEMKGYRPLQTGMSTVELETGKDWGFEFRF